MSFALIAALTVGPKFNVQVPSAKLELAPVVSSVTASVPTVNSGSVPSRLWSTSKLVNPALSLAFTVSTRLSSASVVRVTSPSAGAIFSCSTITLINAALDSVLSMPSTKVKVPSNT